MAALKVDGSLCWCSFLSLDVVPIDLQSYLSNLAVCSRPVGSLGIHCLHRSQRYLNLGRLLLAEVRPRMN